MHALDYAVIVAYFSTVIFIGLRVRKSVHTSEDFFLSGRSLSVLTTSFAFVAANMGSFELMGASATAAKYGMFAAQLSWIGCVPAMIFSGLVMARFFYGSRARSVPEYLRMRFDEKTRTLNAVNFAFLTIFTSGLSLYGLAVVFHALFRWPIDFSIWVSAGTVLAYVYLGGLRASIYTEVLQFFLIVAGTLPLSVMIVHGFGGIAPLLQQLPENMAHAWKPVLHPHGTAYGAGLFSVIVCLGVSSFAYWSTDFLVVQRVLAARDLDSAQKTPIFASFPRMLLPFLTVLPGLAAVIVIPRELQGNFNMAIPLMLLHYYPAGLLGVGISALLASFMSGMAGNVTAFNTVWTYDLYQTYLAPHRSDRHYLIVGRIMTVVGIFISIAAAYTARGFPDIFDYWALVSTIFVAAPFATFVLGVFTRRVEGNAAFAGMLAGIMVTLGHYILSRLGSVHYGSDLAMDFYGGFYGFSANLILTFLVTCFKGPRKIEKLPGLIYWDTPKPSRLSKPFYRKPTTWALASALVVIALNIIYR
ncbi:MAG TPA: sodium/solute symporter [Candidatus Angelobacter sp.]|jgi:SSS family solute:Na+ symporter|nr:sodium/solute symporter [Candidatus Angelobacter sp.]